MSSVRGSRSGDGGESGSSGDPGVEYLPPGAARTPDTRTPDARTPGGGDRPPEWSVWSWREGSGRRFPWLGILLVLVGVLLFVQHLLLPGASLTGLVLVALGTAFAGAWLVGGSRWSMIPALVLLALGLARLAGDLRILTGNGWTSLFLGLALLAIWGIGQAQRRPHGWALWLGGLLSLIGLIQVSDRLTGIPEFGFLWPLVLVAIGLALILGGRLPGRSRTP